MNVERFAETDIQAFENLSASGRYRLVVQLMWLSYQKGYRLVDRPTTLLLSLKYHLQFIFQPT